MSKRVLVLTDVEPDDWGMLLMLHRMLLAFSVQLVVVVTDRSAAVLAQAATNVRAFLPGAQVYLGELNEERGGGYPMSVLDGVETPSYHGSRIDGIVGIVGAAALSDLRDTTEGSRVPLLIYGGVFNLRHAHSRHVYDDWVGPRMRFDSMPAFGNETAFTGTGRYMTCLTRMADADDAGAAHVLLCVRAWNAYLLAKFDAKPPAESTPREIELREAIRADPMQGCVADAALPAVLALWDGDELVGSEQSFRPVTVPAPNDSTDTFAFKNALRAVFRREMETIMVSLLHGNYPAKLPFFDLTREQ
jgi:hypothetical protein